MRDASRYISPKSTLRTGSRNRKTRFRPHPLLWGVLGAAMGSGLIASLWWFAHHSPDKVMLYWLTPAQGKLAYVTQEQSVWAGSSEQTVAETLGKLLHGSGNPLWISAIPPGTRLLSVRMEGNEDIFINFSPEFAQGGGTSSLQGRLLQVVYTVTSQNPQAKVWITLDGKALSPMSGDGLELPQPLTRATLAKAFSLPTPQP